ncbi:MAG: 8-amino-7-oxononanoate synthase [Dissulfurimicrobium sp.]|uniref:8-amino-7-oxononanoate synthase n=1 Tax=Dissulfurimicrobium sp. TaxID=2022436 RepID=UPI00404A9B85
MKKQPAALYPTIEHGLLRTLEPIEAIEQGRITINKRVLIDFASNDYLGISKHPVLIKGANMALERWGAGARASRLMSGDFEIHHELEQSIARLKGTETAILFGSGYLANTGVINALCGKGDVVFSDRFIHASMVDGILLSGARFFRFRHNDLDHLESLLKQHRDRYKRALILVESLYSMEGDEADIAGIVELKRRFDAILMVDEAHAVGVFGGHGEGLVPVERARDIDLMIGTFGKALGGYGAFVAVSKALKGLLINRARTFIFSTALPPSVLGANIAAIGLVAREGARRAKVLDNSMYLRARLRESMGLDVAGRSQIVPVMVGDNVKAMMFAERLKAAGFFVKAVRPPTVPEGTSRIRLSITAWHSTEDIDALVEAMTT